MFKKKTTYMLIGLVDLIYCIGHRSEQYMREGGNVEPILAMYL